MAKPCARCGGSGTITCDVWVGSGIFDRLPLDPLDPLYSAGLLTQRGASDINRVRATRLKVYDTIDVGHSHAATLWKPWPYNQPTILPTESHGSLVSSKGTCFNCPRLLIQLHQGARFVMWK